MRHSVAAFCRLMGGAGLPPPRRSTGTNLKRGCRASCCQAVVPTLLVLRIANFAGRAPGVGVINAAAARPVALHEERDGHALRNIEDVFVGPAAGRRSPALGVAVQVENIDVVERFLEVLTHAAKRRTVQVAVIGDKRQHAAALRADLPLAEAEELDVIV